MIAVLRAALVIARRDYVATVWSRAFILFLIGPLFPILFGLMFGAVGARMQAPEPAPVIAAIAPQEQGEAILAARTRLAAAGADGIPQLRIVKPEPDQIRQRGMLLTNPDISAVLSLDSEKPVLYGNARAIEAHAPLVSLMLQNARGDEALRSAKIKLESVVTRGAPKPEEARDASGQVTLARGAQLVLLVLTMILAGMLLSNMMEEKSSKVIEILAAAVPVDAIFLGKLIAMLGMSLTGIMIWSGIAFGAVSALAPNAAQMGDPAVGWPVFLLLGVVYFMASYLLLGALFLGIGAQASTVREVQTLSMPVSMGQLVIFGLATATVERPDSLASLTAMIFPWSSPFAMLARAAERPEIWPHVLAIGWQMLAVGFIIRTGARLFRRSVLKSGGGGFWKRIIGRSSRTR